MKKHFNDEENSVIENNADNEQVEVHMKKQSGTGNKFVIGMLCVLIAVVFWCYANYLDDPIIQKEITVDFVLVNGDATQDILPDKVNILICGEKSLLNSITNDTITIHVDISAFKNQNEINYKINFPKGLHSHITHQTLILGNRND